MARSAQDKFNEYLDECRETNDAVNEFVKASYENYNRTYSYTSGYLESMLKDLLEVARILSACWSCKLLKKDIETLVLLQMQRILLMKRLI